MRQFIATVLFGILVIDAICLVISWRKYNCKNKQTWKCPQHREWKCYALGVDIEYKASNACVIEQHNKYLKNCHTLYCKKDQGWCITNVFIEATSDNIVECMSSVLENSNANVTETTARWCYAADICKEDGQEVRGYRYYHRGHKKFGSKCQMAHHNCQHSTDYHLPIKTDETQTSPPEETTAPTKPTKATPTESTPTETTPTETTPNETTPTTTTPTTTTEDEEVAKWCDIARNCEKGPKICGKEINELFYVKFPDYCSMAKYNCHNKTYMYNETDMAGCVQFAARRAWELEHRVACLNSFDCPHNGRQKCGINRMGLIKRFNDICDMIKFNCRNRQDYIRTHMKMCSSLKQLPPRYDRHLPKYHPIRKRAAIYSLQSRRRLQLGVIGLLINIGAGELSTAAWTTGKYAPGTVA